MTEDDQRYLGEQLSLFTNGYEWIVIHFDVHLAAEHDQIQIGYTVVDGLTREWIAAQVPQEMVRLSEAPRAAAVMAEVIEFCRERVEPF